MDETPRLSTLPDGVHFEQTPDPLLSMPTPRGPNLYAPGHLDEFTRGFARPRTQDLRQRRAAALRAHPSSGTGILGLARMDKRSPHVSQITKNRWVALIFALMFGAFGAHNFYLGKHKRAAVNVLVWFACTLTSSAFAMLPVLALVMVECVQIVRRSGAYADLP
ncbi:TM2 domain-containing protein [Trueperella pyogenes]|uniref:TM2 domain-containing protein n=1 Tax=Trueperella pyogenes TaxID=1661 RepID=UPI00345D7FC0